MIYALLTFGMIVLLMAGIILAARVRPPEKEEGRKGVSRRLEIIRRSSLLH